MKRRLTKIFEIEEYINNFKNSISKKLVVEDKRIKILQISNIINYNIDILQNHIFNIAEIIFNVVPSFIFQ